MVAFAEAPGVLQRIFCSSCGSAGIRLRQGCGGQTGLPF